MSRPIPTRLVSFSDDSSPTTSSRSLPSSSRYGANSTTERGYSSSLVEPAIDDGDVMMSESLGSQTSVNIRRKEAARLIGTSSKSREYDDFEDSYLMVPSGDTNKREDHSTSDMQTLIHMVKGNVGTGLLALPLAIKYAGLAVGGICLLLLGLIATHCMVLLVNVAHKLTERHPQFQTLNYAQAAEVATSEYSRKRKLPIIVGTIVNVFLIITQFGFCCVYFVFIADNLNQVSCSAFNISLSDTELNAIHAWIAIIILPVIVFCWIRNLETLSPFSMIANVCILISLIIILYDEIYRFSSPYEDTKAAALIPTWSVDVPSNSTTRGFSINLVPSSVKAAALFFGNAIYSFEGIGMVLPLENKMTKPKHFKRVLYTGMAVVIFLYLSVGMLGYAVYGNDIKASITLNLLESRERIAASIAFLIAKSFYAYAVFASFMLQFYVPMDFLEPHVKKGINWLKEKLFLVYRLPGHHQKVDTVILLTFRTLMVLIIASFALALPDLSDLIALIGAVASSALALIFPPLLHIMVFVKLENLPFYGSCSQTTGKQTLWIVKDILIMLLGVIGLMLGTYASIDGLVSYFQENQSKDNTCVSLYSL